MDCRLVSRRITLFSVLLGLALADQSFNCCDLPIKIELQLNYDYEFSIGSESVGVVRRSVLTAHPPFAVHENTSFILDKCVDFDQKTSFENEKGSRVEKRVHHHGLPCNRTALNNPLQGDNNTATENPLHGRNKTTAENPLYRHSRAGIVGVFFLVVVVGALLLWRLRRRNGEPNNVV